AEAEPIRVLGERDRIAALGGAATHFVSGQLWVPQGDEGQGNEPSFASPTRPVVDHPVVVDLDAQKSEILIVPLGEALTAEAREGVGKVDGHVHVVRVHVGEPGGLVPCAFAEIVVGGGFVDDHLVGHSGRRVQAAGGDFEVLVEPDVAERSVVRAFEAVHAPEEAELHLLANDSRNTSAQRWWQLLLPQIMWFQDVVVDGDDARHLLERNRGGGGRAFGHGGLLRRSTTYLPSY